MKQKDRRNQKILYDPKNNLFKPEEDYYEPISNAFSSNYIEYESDGDKDKSLSIKEYLNMMKPYLSGIINDYNNQGEWEIHLTLAVKAFSSKDSEETQIMYSKSDKIEVTMGNETDKIIEEHFDYF